MARQELNCRRGHRDASTTCKLELLEHDLHQCLAYASGRWDLACFSLHLADHRRKTHEAGLKLLAVIEGQATSEVSFICIG